MTGPSAPSERDPHPSEGVWRAYLDHELGVATAIRCAVHVRRCAECRTVARAVRDRGRAAADLLAVATAQRAGRRPRPHVGGAVAGIAAAVLAALILGTALRGPATHARTAGAMRVQDVCCFNLDGGGTRDDGVLTVSGADEVVECVLLYEDRAGTRTFSPHDPLRFISRAGGCEPDLVVAAAIRTLRGARSGS
jgi:hypothetical protein